jgi:hypothetical protein
MDFEKAQARYDELYEILQRKIVIADEAANQLNAKYIATQNAMLPPTGDYQTSLLNLRSTPKGKDLLTLEEAAAWQSRKAQTEMAMAEFNLRWFIAGMNSGLYRGED